MADQEIALRSFPLTCPVEVNFNAADIAGSLAPTQIAELIEQLDAEVGHWELTLLILRRMEAQVKAGLDPSDPLLKLSCEELEMKLMEIQAEEVFQ